MDNAARAWELPGAMRTAALALVVTMALLAVARVALASDAKRAVQDANAALAAEPPDREAAGAALRRATSANDDAEAVAEAYFLLGSMDEGAGAFSQAIVDDRACMAAAPNTRWALRASDRIDWLRARSEGEFVPLARLERVRRDPALAADPAAIDGLARDAEAFPPGTVRVEARMLVAEAWLGRMHRPDDAITELRRVVDDPRADPLTSRLAERELVDALVAAGHVDEAATEARTHANRLDPRFAKQVQRLIVRRAVRRVAVGVLLAFATLVALGFARAQRRRVLGQAWQAVRPLVPVSALFVAFTALGGGYLASRYESGNAEPFLLLGAAALPLVLVARAWSAVGSQRTVLRAARAALCGATVVAAAFVLLEVVNPVYLEGFGL